MRTTIYELLGMIKDGKAPKKIKFADEVLVYDVYKIDYVDSDGDGLFNEYAWITELNDEVEILNEPKEYKIEKIDQTLNRIDMDDDYYRYIMENRFKINEIIDELNKLKEK